MARTQRRLPAITAEGDGPLYRRLDAADIIIDYELSPGSAVGGADDWLNMGQGITGLLNLCRWPAK